MEKAPRLLRKTNFVADQLELKAAGLTGQAANDMRKAAKIMRQSSDMTLIVVEDFECQLEK